MAKTCNINGVEFLKLNVIYPLLVVTFQNENFLCEIVVRKKQYTFCTAVANLTDKYGKFSFLDRKIHSKECGYLEISALNFAIFMRVF